MRGLRWFERPLAVSCIALVATALVIDADGRSAPTQIARHSHMELDIKLSHHVGRHTNGEAALEWLSKDSNIISQLARQEWAQNLVIGYAAGYTYETVKPLIFGFLGNVKEPSQLVLFTPSGEIKGMPDSFSSRVVVQKHEMPTHLAAEDLPYPVSLRFYVTTAFLRLTNHTGTIFFLDTRDVFIQRDPFEKYADGLMHFPMESTSYRLRGPFTHNSEWLLGCYGEETMRAIGGMYVLNSGTLIGPSQSLLAYFEMMKHEFQQRWHCMRLHGSDQAAHNYLVYTGRIISLGLEFQIEDQTTGHFAFIAYTHPAVWEFRYVSEHREELCNREGLPFVAIHLWPGENRVAKKVVLPYVAEKEGEFGGHQRPEAAESSSSPASSGLEAE